MTRLPRSRKGKTPIDVTTTEQNGLKRVRFTTGHDGARKVNSDLDPQEVFDLVTILSYHLGVITGHIEDTEPEVEFHAEPEVEGLAGVKKEVAT